jgi:hypothetical protein
MKMKLYKISLILWALFISSAAFAQQTIVYVGPTNYPVCDTVITTMLDELEHNVTWITTAEYKTNFTGPSAYNDYDVLMFSEAIGSGDLKPFKDHGFPIPGISLEGFAPLTNRWDMIPEDKESEDFLQAGSASKDTGILTLVIEDVDHWIANQYDPDYELVWSTNMSTNGVTGFVLEDYIDGAVALGHYNIADFTDLPSVWAIPEGSIIQTDATEIQSNIVIIGSIANGMTGATQEFIHFLDLCIKWVTGNIESSVNEVQSTRFNVWPNPTNGIVNFSLSLPVSGNARVNIYNLTGKLMKTKNSDDLFEGNNTLSIDISGFANANYMYEIITPNNVVRGKICKN